MSKLILLGISLFTVLASCSSIQAEEQRSFLAADSSKQIIAIINEDLSTRWKHEIGPLHDLSMLPNGHVLFQTNWTTVAEIDPSDDHFVWKYDAKAAGDSAKRFEIHAFERDTKDGSTMIAESGRSRIIKALDQKIVQITPLQVAKSDAHRDTRLVRILDNGNYLVCQEADAVVREYTPAGEIVWQYEVPLFGHDRADGHGPEAFGNQCFAALRLASGNTLISTGNGHSIIEVDAKGEIVWKLESSDLPEVELAWITTLQVLPSGNIVFGNCHAGPNNPQIIEVDRDKHIIWSFHDFERFGNALTNTQILSVNGVSVLSQ